MLARLRSRPFVGGTIVMVAIVVFGIFGYSLVGGRTTPVRVGFSGESQALEAVFTASATALGQPVTVSNVADEAQARTEVSGGTLDILVIGSARSPTIVVKQSASSVAQAALERAVVVARLTAAGVTPATLATVMGGVQVPVQTLQPKGPGMTQDRVVGLSVAILLYIVLGVYGSMVAQGVVEEKATRIMEIVLATVPPSQLLAGKVVGIGLVAMLQVGIVAIVTLASVAVTNVVTTPALEVGAVLGYLMWFLLGFLLFATGYATLAALVSRPDEVQSAVTPVAVFQIGSYLLAYLALANPSSPVVTIASMLPPFAPILMPVRTTGGDVPPWEIGIALVLTVAAIAGLTRLAGRVYANSAMRIGTRVRFRDAFHGS
jgi:ABC-2 type transport system permease protein